MNVKLLAWTQPNPTFSSFTDESDIATILQGKGTFAENLIEYAGRVCYHSTARMGHAPDFVVKRVKEGHEDICEHAHAIVSVDNDPDRRPLSFDDPLKWLQANSHIKLTPGLNSGAHWIVSANVRAWLDLYRRGHALNTLSHVRPVAPAVFDELEGGGGFRKPSHRKGYEAQMEERGFPFTPRTLPDVERKDPAYWGGGVQKHPWIQTHEVNDLCRVTLLAYTTRDPHEGLWQNGSATFLIEGMSRACSHQFVRHRLASFSQCSQRYIDMEKGGWKAIIPPAIAENEVAAAKMQGTWEFLEEAYRLLRDVGIRKEDARFLLPNACETRMVVSMPIEAWEHFVWLRAVDKAAQWEIRQIGIAILRSLSVIAPAKMEDAMERLQEIEGKNRE